MEQECKHLNIDFGYGLAAGGIGSYEFCMNCNKILNFEQDPEFCRDGDKDV